MTYSEPLIAEARGDARKAIRLATSSGFAGRPSGMQRYSDFEKLIPGISQKMLAQQLRQLEVDGIVARKVQRHPLDAAAFFDQCFSLLEGRPVSRSTSSSACSSSTARISSKRRRVVGSLSPR